MSAAPTAEQAAKLQAQAMDNEFAAQRLNLTFVLFLVVLVCGFAPRTASWLGSGSLARGWCFTGAAIEARQRDDASSITHQKKRAVPTSSLSCNLRWFYNRFLLQTIPWVDYTVGQAAVAVVLLGLSLFFLFYGAGNLQENFKRPGWIAQALLPSIFLLATKNSAITLLIGKGAEKLNFLHRLLGQLSAVLAIYHSVVKVAACVQADYDIPWSEPMWLWGLISFIGAILLLVFSLPPVRHLCYTLFLATHIIGWIAFLFGLYFHVPKSALPYFVAALVPILLDFVLRALKTKIRPAVFSLLPNDMTRIEVAGVADGWRAGQWAALRCPTVGWESHPFTISSAGRSTSVTGSRNMTFMTKATGDWTIRLMRAAEAKAIRHQAHPGADLEKQASRVSQLSVSLAVEGPYGGTGSMVLEEFPAVLLCAGGSGVTVILSALEEIVSSIEQGKSTTKTIWCAWSVRQLEQLSWIEERLTDLLLAIKANEIDFQMFIHCSRAGTQPCDAPLVERYLKRFRCDHRDLLSKFVDSTIQLNGHQPGAGLAVVCCGPASITRDLRKACSEVDRKRHAQVGGVTLHSETFGF